MSFTNSTISFTANGVAHTLTVPSATIQFSPTATCASTTLQSGTWVTTVPISGSDEIFLTGLVFKVPSGGLPGGINPVSWTGTFDSNKSGVSMSWKWGATVYTTFSTNYNALMVKPTHSNACGISNSDHAGTPEAFKAFVTDGARGGGGSTSPAPGAAHRASSVRSSFGSCSVVWRVSPQASMRGRIDGSIPKIGHAFFWVYRKLAKRRVRKSLEEEEQW